MNLKVDALTFLSKFETLFTSLHLKYDDIPVKMLMQIPLIRMRVTVAIMHCRAANGETNKFVFYEHQDIMQIFLPPAGEEQHRMGVIIHTIGVRDTSSYYKNVFL